MLADITNSGPLVTVSGSSRDQQFVAVRLQHDPVRHRTSAVRHVGEIRADRLQPGQARWKSPVICRISWNHGASPALGALFTLLGNTADVSPAAYSAQLRQLSPDAAFAPGARIAAHHEASPTTLSCPQFRRTTAMLMEGRCAWMRGGPRNQPDSGNGITSYNLNRVTWQIGGQTEFAPGWFIGGSLAYEDSRLSIRKMVAVH